MYSVRDPLVNLMSIKVNVLRQEIILYGASEESGVTEYHWTLNLEVAGSTPGSCGNHHPPLLLFILQSSLLISRVNTEPSLAFDLETSHDPA